MAGCVEGIRRALVLGLVLIAGTAIMFILNITFKFKTFRYRLK